MKNSIFLEKYSKNIKFYTDTREKIICENFNDIIYSAAIIVKAESVKDVFRRDVIPEKMMKMTIPTWEVRSRPWVKWGPLIRPVHGILKDWMKYRPR